jgi:uncharacterized protein (TIGR03086 family)
MDADVAALHRRAVAGFGARVEAVQAGDWAKATPCSEWDVRALVNHLVNEELWTPELFAGRTIAEVGDRFDGDLLGDDPKGAWASASGAAVAAVAEAGALDRIVHLSFGDFPGHVYAMQLFADHLIHTWDLARGIGGDERLDPELVEACSAWFDAGTEQAFRGAGAIGPRVDLPDGADAQARLLARFGRQP